MLSKEREQNICSCFDVSVEFFDPQNIDEFDVIIEIFQRPKNRTLTVFSEKNNVFDRLIAMDNVLGIVDRSNKFGSFLTVTRKINFTVAYVFHTMYPSKLNRQIIISQTKIFNIFPGSIQIVSISKILSANCNRYTFDYIPNRDLWLNRFYFEISNSGKKECLTIDCCNFNSIGPSKYRTSAESNTRQICYYNRNKKDKLFNRFLSERKQQASENITFEIKSIIEETNNENINYYKLNNELNDFKNDHVNDNKRNFKRTIQYFGRTDNTRRKSVSRKKLKFLSR